MELQLRSRNLQVRAHLPLSYGLGLGLGLCTIDNSNRVSFAAGSDQGKAIQGRPFIQDTGTRNTLRMQVEEDIEDTVMRKTLSIQL